MEGGELGNTAPHIPKVSEGKSQKRVPAHKTFAGNTNNPRGSSYIAVELHIEDRKLKNAFSAVSTPKPKPIELL